MKQIVEQYGAAMIGVLIGAILFAIISGISFHEKNGILQGAGELFQGNTKTVLTEKESSAYGQYRKTALPVISVNALESLHTGESISLERICSVRDGKGKTVSPQLLSVKKADGTETGWEKKNGNDYVKFEEPGIYELWIAAADSMGRQQYAVVSIPVQRG